MRFEIRLFPDLDDQGGAFVAHDLLLIGLAQHTPHRGVEHRGKLVVGSEDSADGLIKPERVDDFISDEAVDFESLIVGGQHFQVGTFGGENAAIEKHHVLDEGNFEMQAGIGDEATPGDRLPESQYDRLFGLRNGEQGAAAEITATSSNNATRKGRLFICGLRPGRARKREGERREKRRSPAACRGSLYRLHPARAPSFRDRDARA